MSQDDGNSPAGVKHASVINIPLKSGNTTSGFLRLKDRRENHFSKTDMELFESIARPLGISLSNQRAQAALRERVK
ncbi:MAG: GAF domain-containing protein, partial [Spirochaetaceae bacterium]